MKRLSAFQNALALAFVLALAGIGAVDDARAGGLSVLHTFAGSPNDGAFPDAGVIEDAQGNLYGTTAGGGAGCQGSGGCGTVFKLAPNGTETVLYSFCTLTNCVDGDGPSGNIAEDGAGNLYGTTFSGGANDYGTIFKVAPNGSETVLYSFCSHANCTDGAHPESGLLRDLSGNLYGTTFYGGTGTGVHCGCGTVFKLSATGVESVLYSFCSLSNCSDGLFPVANVTADSSGNLYGTTLYGGTGNGYDCYDSNGCGTVFKISTDGTETVLHSFCIEQNCPDGMEPRAGLIMDLSANLYGTTGGGGTGAYCGVPGCGTVFKIAPDGTESVIYSFCSQSGCADGSGPDAGVIADSKNRFYGMTSGGGKYALNRAGTIFRIGRKAGEHVLASFGKKTTDGISPEGGLIADSTGYLYGTTQSGGNKNCNDPEGCGVVFKRKE